MENNQNGGAQRRPDTRTGGGNHRNTNNHKGRGGAHHHRPQRRPAGEETAVEQMTEGASRDSEKPMRQEEKGTAAKRPERSRSQNRGKNAPRSPKGGEHSSENPLHLNGKSESDEERGTVRRTAVKDTSAETAGEDGGMYFHVPAARVGLSDVTDHLFDDTFLSLHEESRPDPEADQYAAAILDAEGPLLFRGETPAEAEQSPEIEMPMQGEEEEAPVAIVGIRFRRTGKVYYFAPGELILHPGQYAVVETARGLEYGEVWRGNSMVPAKEIVLPLRPVVRIATKEDTQHHRENKEREVEAFRICQEKIAAHELDMKLVETEYTFDNTKLLFYFTSAGRVDFRELVKDLAGVFRTRIELRQIGIRDEAKILGGLGTCGRPLCCASFLADFVQVSIKMAKEQNLSLNSTKISGCCGRLMCCLRYESDTYEEEIRLTPSIGSLVQTPEGQGTVLANNPLKGTVRVRVGDGEGGEIKDYHRDNIRVLRAGVLPEEE